MRLIVTFREDTITEQQLAGRLAVAYGEHSGNVWPVEWWEVDE